MDTTYIQEVIPEGKFCTKCGSIELGEQHKDGRYKCKDCHHKFSAFKNKIDYYTLHVFSLGWCCSAYKATKFLNEDFEIEVDYKKVYHRFMKFRREIFEYTEKHKVPEQPSIVKIMNGETIKGHNEFCKFAKERLKGLRNINKDNLPLYQREMEFRYRHRKKGIFFLLWKIHFGWDYKF